ncbi:helix-turn-helix domain-containing protein [Deltaproteobacteria bacterium OttesenSCG-928-M10]|nr:helix-turn-helix domain-containing protein [Deltaproteobacteria bacterium OttesenSCG-928-M10]
MKKWYSIGEVAALLGISTHTLRFYSNQGLIEPSRIDGQSGYRYYTYEQFHTIDRIKYLQSLGMSLAEIREALKSGRVDDLLPLLERQLERKLKEIEDIRESAESLAWYIDYYKYLGGNRFPSLLFKRNIGPRWLLGAAMSPGEALFGPGGLRLTILKNSPLLKQLPVLRQTGYILNFEALLDGKIQPEAYFVYLKGDPGLVHDAIRTLPAGEYLCFRGRILTDDWGPSPVADCFPADRSPRLVVADEYEDNLRDFLHCTYEVQIFLGAS